jgi:two-component system OmpR family sensor kinase
MHGSSMRLLTLSLIAVVLAATIGLGRVLDSLFYYVVPSHSSLNNDSVLVLEQLGQELADTLNTLEHPKEFIASWSKQGRYDLSLMLLSDIQLPEALIQQVTSGVPLLLTSDDEFSLYFYLDNQQSLLILKPTFPNNQHETGELKLMLTLLFYCALVLLIWMWAYPLVSRLINLRHSAQLFGKGQLEQRIKVGSVSYVKDLEHEFNHMAQRIQNLVSDVKLLSSAVSHDLRTPLARMRFGIDTIAEEQNPQRQALYLERLSNDVDEMTCLVEILLDYARLEQAMILIDKQKVELNALVKGCVAAKNNVQPRIVLQQSNKPSWAIGDARYLQILLNNLLGNALQYGHNQVAVQIQHNATHISLIIADDGEGFTDDEQDLRKPFVRGKDAADKAKGYGMGLAIVERIVEWHEGELIIARSTQLKGAEITIKLPHY